MPEPSATSHQPYPDQGLIPVVDELHDCPRTRKAYGLPMDLDSLREIGEICNQLRSCLRASLGPTATEPRDTFYPILWPSTGSGIL
ncbi:DUF6079 family protein [Candidatus Sumerlaeota bacterium]